MELSGSATKFRTIEISRFGDDIRCRWASKLDLGQQRSRNPGGSEKYFNFVAKSDYETGN
ncbi:hypothetical protein AG1IA_06408 [Rhizoctonia solani AG-1 IA]|uniref:Uncharacterized protein n=1 Tax=Thanatephorus cucumeris (strain AG1-IA) TaxID=983506 RepID=L8WRY1_THACA|nr:hypothetical protein AG1IA_06408 [Rhizoctonia solani AG-1 IA]